MLLTIDVGNTNITFGVYEGTQVKATFRMMSKVERTSDEYGMNICTLLEDNGIDRKS
ncbi:MAG: type III pantothenate kinase, partial [Lachnospiraceae bacterium]|nr:type III pantothenate kinase [Lachnospiraceae bacterium]